VFHFGRADKRRPKFLLLITVSIMARAVILSITGENSCYFAKKVSLLSSYP